VILLDYDDTLLCSSFLAAHQIRLDSVLPDLSVPLCPLSASAADKAAREVALQLRELEQCVHQLLVNAIKHSQRTIVVTNAGEFKESAYAPCRPVRRHSAVAAAPLFHFQRLILRTAAFCYMQCALSFWTAASCFVRGGLCARSAWKFVFRQWAWMPTILLPCSDLVAPLAAFRIIVPNHCFCLIEAGWVELSAARFFPSILPLLSQVTVISARTAFEHLFPESPLRWKVRYAPTATNDQAPKPVPNPSRENAGWLLVCVHRSPCLLALLVNIFLCLCCGSRGRSFLALFFFVF
jgi:hypothetical protein